MRIDSICRVYCAYTYACANNGDFGGLQGSRRSAALKRLTQQDRFALARQAELRMGSENFSRLWRASRGPASQQISWRPGLRVGSGRCLRNVRRLSKAGDSMMRRLPKALLFVAAAFCTTSRPLWATRGLKGATDIVSIPDQPLQGKVWLKQRCLAFPRQI